MAHWIICFFFIIYFVLFFSGEFLKSDKLLQKYTSVVVVDGEKYKNIKEENRISMSLVDRKKKRKKKRGESLVKRNVKHCSRKEDQLLETGMLEFQYAGCLIQLLTKYHSRITIQLSQS